MHYVLERVTDPDIEPVTLAEMREHLGEFAGNTAKDDSITAMIVAAREWAEEYTGRALVDQSWRLTIIQLAGYVGDAVSGYRLTGRFEPVGTDLYLRRAPVLALTSFKSVDSDGAETTIDAATYELREADSKWPRLVALSGATWTGADQLRVVFRAGYADRTGSPIQTAADVPERFKMAMRLWIEAHYDRDPASMDKLIDAAKALLKPLRVELGFA
jgi:hypothetical protein